MSLAVPPRPLVTFFETIKFWHTVFALPFALVSMLLAAEGLPGVWTVFWILAACVGARTAAMSFNRLADRQFDARNPRTANRPSVTGAVSPAFLTVALLLSSVLFIFSAAMLNTLCFLLSFPTLAVLLGYSLTKRFTSYSHFFLGAALGLAPVGAWVAVREEIAVLPLLLGAAVVLWVAGFDILYSCQDYEVDRRERQLHSIPKRLGIAGAMRFARKVHAASLVLFLLFYITSGLGLGGLLALLVVACLLWYQHRIISPRDLSRIDAAFFTANGAISLLFFALVLVDVLAG